MSQRSWSKIFPGVFLCHCNNLLSGFFAKDALWKMIRLKVPNVVSRDSAVGIATCYRLDGLGLEHMCGRGFPRPSRPASRPKQKHETSIKCKTHYPQQ